MDPEGESQPTQPTQQATQNVLDPRRLGKQNSGFTDEDISDIICVLIPCTENARREVARIANENSQHLVGRDEAENADLDYDLEDEASRFGGLIPHDGGGHAIALRLSAAVKNPLQGFAFGRNLNRCDICFKEDPCRRLSNIHFRIFLNEYGVLMLEDQSTNGTIVDDHLLKSRSRNPVDTKRMLQSGSKISILMHRDTSDLAFRVRVPRRDGDYEVAYRRNLGAYLQHLKEIAEDQEQTISAGPDGHVDIFSGQGRGTLKGALGSKQRYIALPNEPTQDGSERLAREWNGSDKYHRVGQIGKGAFATVHKVTSKYDGMPYAAKELDKRRFMKNGVLDQKVENEMKIMQRVRHPNIVQYIEHIDWLDRSLIIIMELVPGGDLGGWIGSRGRLPEPTVKVMAQQLINALGYLHENNITHRDVKPDNILIQSTQPFVVKLTDFGLSKMIDKEETFLRTFCGTLLYCAPEVYSEYAEYDEYGRRNPRNRSRRAMPGQRYDHAVDIWSLGGVLFYALTGSPPYPVRTGISYSELLHQIMTKQLDISPLVQANVTGDGISFLVDMLQRRPEKRATVQMLQEHPWLGGPGSMRPPQSLKASFDEVSDDQLEQSASQLSLADRQTKQIPSDDEILDDDFFEENNESEKENYTFMPGNQGQRLFGEVNVSAIGSSGVIPSNRLNLPLSGSSYSGTDILDSEIRDSFESQKLSTPKQQPRSQKSQNRSSGGVPLSAAKSYSVDALNNMTFDVESQSLGGAESFLDNLNMKSTIGGELLGRSMSEFNTSKRKPAYDTSDEYEGAQMPEKPTIKRLKSEVTLELPSDVEDAENLLYTLIPPISRIQSGRQMDSPVHKSIYWVAGDKKSWHLRYPEMTQLQHDAFKEAAARRGEEFAEGKSPLWDLAMKFFPPVEASFDGDSPLGPSDNGAPLTVDTKLESKEPEPVPSTAAPDDDDIPDTAPTETNIIVPVLTPAKRVVASMQSSSSSVVQNVSIAVTESVTSWGRALENTRVYQARQEVRVPKYAFKLLLWKEAYDPSREFRPWNLVSGGDDEASSYHFYISTKATNGIRVNDTLLESHEPKRPDAPSRHWIRLHDGDAVTVWNSGDASRPMQPGQQRTTLVFRCGWGGSARPRSHAPSSQPGTAAAALVPDAIARRLDEACARAEKRVHVLAESELKMAEADADVAARSRHIERERQRSRAFEARRLEACRLLRAGTGSSSSRRTSPAPPAALPDTAGPSSHVAGVVVSPPPPLQVLQGQGQGQGQGGYLSGKTVVMGQPPGLMRHGSPLKDALVAMAEAEEEMKRR